MTSIGRICIYVYISSNTRIYSISPEGFIEACVSVTLLQGGSNKKNNIYIYNATLGGGRAKKIYIYIFIFFLLDPPTPCEKKMRRMWPVGTRSMPMPSLKKWNTWGQVQGTPGGEVKGTPGGEVGIHKGDK